MSETVSEEIPVAPEPTPPEGEVKETPKSYDAEYVDKLRKEAARYRTEAKAGADAARRLKEIEDRDLSDLEKARRDAETATGRLADYERTVLRQRIALEKGLPPSLVSRLQGATEDEVTADADALMALIKTPNTPRPDLSQGARATSAEDQELADYERFYPSTKR